MDAQTTVTDLFPEDTILPHQVVDNVLLTAVDPTGESEKEYLKRQKVGTHPPIITDQKLFLGQDLEFGRVFTPYGLGQTVNPSIASFTLPSWRFSAFQRPDRVFGRVSYAEAKEEQRERVQKKEAVHRRISRRALGVRMMRVCWVELGRGPMNQAAEAASRC